MKHKGLLFLFAMFLLLVSCAEKPKNNSQNNSVNEIANGVEVLYFHSKKRCATCNAIEQGTEEVIKQDFQQAIDNGTLIYRTIDISTAEGEALADSYEITWSSLLIVSWHNGEEKIENLTDFAFLYARNDAQRFKSELASLISNSIQE